MKIIVISSDGVRFTVEVGGYSESLSIANAKQTRGYAVAHTAAELFAHGDFTLYQEVMELGEPTAAPSQARVTRWGWVQAPLRPDCFVCGKPVYEPHTACANRTYHRAGLRLIQGGRP